MVLAIGQIGFFAAVVIVALYIVLRVITGKGLPDDDGVFMLMMSPIGGFLLGCIVGNTVETFGIPGGVAICVIVAFLCMVQYYGGKAKQQKDDLT